MEITRFADARAYAAPKHHDMRGLRLQGFDASSAAFAWTGLSHFLAGGGAEIAAQSIAAAAAGAAIRHLHARDPDTGAPTGNPDIYARFLPVIHQATDAVINAEQVAKIVYVLAELGREPATPAEARTRLALKGRDRTNCQ